MEVLALAGMGFQALFGIGHVIDKVIQKFGKPLETIPATEMDAAFSEFQTQNTTPPAPGSAPGSSSEHIPSGKYKPEPSDLAYLLHDEDEDQSPAPGYIVKDLSEYGTKCIPLKVYVSALLRTWETALLLYLPFLFNAAQPTYSQTLILEVSPFLLEKKNKMLGRLETTTLNSDLPHDFAGNIDQFFNFIKLFIFLKQQNKGKTLIKGIAGESLKQIPDNFTIILVAGNDKVYLRVVNSEKIEYYLPPNIPAATLNQKPITIPDKTIQNINSKIVDSIVTPSDSNLNNKYESYDDKRLDIVKFLTLPQTIYSTFPVLSYAGVDFTNFENIGKYGPDIFSFLKWVIHVKSHPKNTPILFVSHSKTMNEFLKMMISNLNYDYTDTSNIFPPTTEFVNVCTSARKTNTWSMRFKYLGYNVTGFRHAQSCDNMYKTLDKPTSKMDKAKKYASYGASLGTKKLKELSDRNKVGKYTNLSLWGIFSTLIFIHSNKDIISDFANVKINESGLMILSGMDQQPKDNIERFGVENELTCGDVSSRFLVSSAGAGAGASNYKQIENFVDIVPYSIPLYKMDITARQRMSNELCCLDNIFKIEFDDCDKDGCKIKVTYIGPSTLTDVDLAVLKGQNSQQREEILKKIQNIMKRSVNINIDKDIANNTIVLTLQNVNPGGLVTSASGKQEIKNFFKRKFGKDEENKVDFDNTLTDFQSDDKIKISDAFQNSVAFLMGVDIFNTDALTYDALYNSFILYSNLLIRQLLNTYLLISSDKAVNWGEGYSKQMYTNTKDFLSKGTEELYGGKKNKKHNKHKNHKK
jgi:hypothetical protein